MKILLDSHILLWLAWDKKENLSPQAVELLDDPTSEIYFSLASLWEIAIKSSLGKPDFDIDVEALEQGLIQVGCRMLAIELPHILKQAQYPFIHRDPFDRLLMAQAEVENVFFMTADTMILKYQKPYIIDVRSYKN
ncbi:type II toxin-antitoxin system VapC family toxin [Glaesserella parasuis]|uniref:Type II toxin-antitoxin system VapC family toxin n=4 Tax=Glaesserella parasuis TaxID=738 RepID=A0A6G6HNA3_GLAPU|nr:type II toxin-antitoxin system VapC family toxin [Glaesserella parasuis]EQA04385.1 isopropylmalate isomerase large subunit [Glaesserella parasuis MN-H]EQA04427.1 isopropylmalate isomerase large subunit [Glaesserella parasuis SW114]EQA06081.1 isopropylmalate isomerase large subunit [Glaesserella parasuis 12939]EQA14058.1 isopropylmalate isomerase large subunit [Glaesserella parasuis H465]EQA14417.1 isopropylmalate isomerase large subunit [Glaesserella parasuis SW140]EQA15175.1 NADH-quinone 